MVKSRFTSLDVRAMVNSIRPEAVGCKVTNVYDINSRVYILKLGRTNYKRFVLLESGNRFHTTEYQRDKSALPSSYTMKLRKHIRTKRLTDIQQLGSDRIIDFTFGKGDTAVHLILELFTSGNLILADHKYKILVLLRTHSSDDAKVMVKQAYNIDLATRLLVCEIADFQWKIEELLDKAADREETQLQREDESVQAFDAKKGKKGEQLKRTFKKKVNHIAIPLVTLLHKLAAWADPGLCAHCIAKAMRELGLECGNPFKVTADDVSLEDLVLVLQMSAEHALQLLQRVSRPGDLGGGALAELAPEPEVEGDDVVDDDEEEEGGKESTAAAEAPKPWEAPCIPGWIVRKMVHVPPEDPKWRNDEFTPLPPDSSSAAPEATVKFLSFHKAVDEFFAQVEEFRGEEQKAQKAQSMYAKVQKIREDQERRIGQLEAEQEASEKQAACIEASLELVEATLQMINLMVASQLDWAVLWQEVKKQQRMGHPIAEHIHSLDLQNNQCKLLLDPNPDADDIDLQDEDATMCVVPLDLGLTAHANVAKLHAQRKQWREKTSKTASQAEVAIKQAEKRADQDMKKFQLKQTIKRVRQTWAFEKYLWFVSSENYLVLCGRDGNQNDMLFARHMSAKDVFVCCDVANAKSCFIKNPTGGEVPPATLREAGTFSLCHSAAWEKKMTISAWWSYAEQLSRGPPPKEACLFSDGYHVKGHRRFMPPLHTEMGFTVLFHTVGDAVARHRGERRSRYLEALGGSAEQEQGFAEQEQSTAVTGTESEEGQEEAEHSRSDDSDEEVQSPEKVGTSVLESPATTPGGQEELPEADKPPLREPQDQSEDDSDEVEAGNQQEEPARQQEREKSSHARMSKAERKRIKKGGEPEEPDGTTLASKQAAPKAKAVATIAAKAAPKSLPRGQKSKVKKMQKYVDQDEDERELRLLLLGSKTTKRFGSPDLVESPQEIAREAKEPPQVEAGQQSANKQSGKKDAVDKGGRLSAKRKEEKLLTVGCEAEVESDFQLNLLDQLTGQPAAGDEVDYAMPMVAPYCALGSAYSFRVKLTPGPTKKGQAAKLCLKIFEGQVEVPAWRRLVQTISDQEPASLLCGNCKLSAPGIQKLQQQVRKEKLSEKKQQATGVNT